MYYKKFFNKNILWHFAVISCIAFCFGACIFGSFKCKTENPYSGKIKDDYYYYISNKAEEVGLDPLFPFAILLAENEHQIPFAVSNLNKNQTRDLGLFQINSKYSDYFAEKYWEEETDFDIMNWQHNSSIAIYYMNDLYKSFDGDIEKAAAAYNCGSSRVKQNKIPESTKLYVEKVKKNYETLKNYNS